MTCSSVCFSVQYLLCTYTSCFGSNRMRNPCQSSSRSRLVCSIFGKIKHKENNKRPFPSNEENISTTMKKKKYEESCVRTCKFNQAWKKEFSRVEFDKAKNEMFCRVCRKYPSVCDKSSRLFLGIVGSSSTSFHCKSLISHNSSRSYYFCFEREKN